MTLCDQNNIVKRLNLYIINILEPLHDVIPDIGMVNLLHYDTKTDQSIPIDYRIYDKGTDGKIKNDHFYDMLSLAKARGSNLEAVEMDAWYSSLENLKYIRNLVWIWVTNLRKNKKVNRNVSFESL